MEKPFEKKKIRKREVRIKEGPLEEKGKRHRKGCLELAS